jgi:glucoamylase
MSDPERSAAFGAPGIEPRWTPSTKEGIGTAYHTSCRVWFTLSHGIVDELYYPHVDSPNTRDLQLLITDGESFCHEERRDLRHELEYPEKNVPLYRLTNSEPNGRYRIVKDILTDPHASVFLMRTRLEILDESLREKLRVYMLLAPHMKGLGQNNSAWWCDLDARKLFHVRREEIHMIVGCAPDFSKRSVGYVGYSDGWQDLQNFRMDWEFYRAENGNIALTAEIDLTRGFEFTIGVAFGRSCQSAATKLVNALATPFEQHRQDYIQQWKRTHTREEIERHTGDGGSMYRLSRCVLLAHEDKVFEGALVASMSIPWGETKGDVDLGGYHLVWPRDMVQSATALLASGQRATPLRALIWLACVQDTNGEVPQNSWINGSAYWKGKQLDEVSAPTLLAWHLQQSGSLGLFDPWTLVSRAAGYLILNGPVTEQDRWEENSGYSPSTLATMIAALVCTAEFAKERRDPDANSVALSYADWLSDHVEEWTVTNRGELVPDIPHHYVRITPGNASDPSAQPDPDNAVIQIANGGGRHPARNIVGGDFLHLVRFGMRDPLDPLIADSVAVIDRVIKHDLPQGPCWRRYNRDGYGQKNDGTAYDGTGTGRCWPLLTGERGHYELAAGRDAMPFIRALENYANAGGMLPEQVWDADDLPHMHMKRGSPAGSAMPLCWTHAEYMKLVRSHRDGVCVDRIAPVFDRYVLNRNKSYFEIWTFAHQIARMPMGKTLRIITGAAATIRWSWDGWATMTDTEARKTSLGCWFADLPTSDFKEGTALLFTFRWDAKWEGKDYYVQIENRASVS